MFRSNQEQLSRMHSFFALREQLPILHFDAMQDKPVSKLLFLKDYLQFYQLEFSDKICSNHYAGTFTAENYTMAAHYWMPAIAKPKGTIFILHGYYDHVGLYRHVIQFALDLGFIVVAYDQPGHGLSSGEQAVINHFSEYANVLDACLKKSEKFPKPWYCVGQSTGGAVLLHIHMIEKITSPFASITLLAPLIRPAGWTTGKLSYYLLRPFVKKIKRHFSHNSTDNTFIEFCSQDPLQSRYLSVMWVGAMKEWLECFESLPEISIPTLVVQGDADITVDWRYNISQLRKKINTLEYCQIPMARHHLVNEQAAIRNQIFTRLKQFLLAST